VIMYSNCPVDANKYTLMARCSGAVSGKLKSGKLIKPDVCELCGSGLYIEAHHKDYSNR